MPVTTQRPFVGRESQLATLRSAFDNLDGIEAFLLSGTRGSGRRALVSEFLRGLPDDGSWIPFRLSMAENEDGIRCLLRAWGSLVAGIHAGRASREPALDMLRAATEGAEEREAGWYKAVIANIDSLPANTSGRANVQIQLPRDNPLMGMLKTFGVLGSGLKLVIEVQNLLAVTSTAFWLFLAGIVGEAQANGWKLMLVLSPGDSPFGETPEQEGPGSFLKELAERAQAKLLDLPALTGDEAASILSTRYEGSDFGGLAARLHQLTGGHAGHFTELVEHLEDEGSLGSAGAWQADDDLNDLDLADLVPDAPGHDGEGPSFSQKLLYLAALEGTVFTSSLLAQAIGKDKDSVDDALDELEDLVEEVSFVKALETWTYRFKRPFYRRWFRDNPPADWEIQPLNFARVMLERYASRAYDYVARAGYLFQHLNEPARAANLLTLALNSDRPEMLSFGLEMLDKLEDDRFGDGLPRLVYTRLADRATNQAPLASARQLVERGADWARRRNDADTTDYFSLLEARILIREKKHDEAAELTNSALSGFEFRKNNDYAGEALNQLAMISMHKREFDEAGSLVGRAEAASSNNKVAAHSHFIRGILAKARPAQNQQEAATNLGEGLKQFAQATEKALQTGNLSLALESGLNQGEAMLLTRQLRAAVPVLERTFQLARALRAGPREHLAARMLGQALVAAGDPRLRARAYEVAKHALKLADQLKIEKGRHIDEYHAGVFALAAGKADEAVPYLRKAVNLARKAGDARLVNEGTVNLGTAQAQAKDLNGARSTWEAALSKATKDDNKSMQAALLQNLARLYLQMREFDEAQQRAQRGLEVVKGGAVPDPENRNEAAFHELIAAIFIQKGNIPAAVERYQVAIGLLKGPANKEVRRNLRQRLDQLRARHAN